jgi:hypothetical protein
LAAALLGQSGQNSVAHAISADQDVGEDASGALDGT